MGYSIVPPYQPRNTDDWPVCPTCQRKHPPEVRVSHHPNGCDCSCKSLHAPDGNNEGPLGCIWMWTFKAVPEDLKMWMRKQLPDHLL